MSLFEIREDGTLWTEEHETKYVPGDKNSKNIWDSLGHMESVRSWWTERKDTTTINFYDGIRKDEYKNDYWIEYIAKFVDGKIISMEVLKLDIIDNTDRKAQDQKWKEEFKNREIFFNKWYMKYLYIPYTKVIRYIFRKYNKIKQKLPSAWKIERFLTPL